MRPSMGMSLVRRSWRIETSSRYASAVRPLGSAVGKVRGEHREKASALNSVGISDADS
jgi:hypothetical protein